MKELITESPNGLTLEAKPLPECEPMTDQGNTPELPRSAPPKGASTMSTNTNTTREKTGALAILEALNRGHAGRGGVDADKDDTRPQTAVEAALSQGAHISPRHENEWAVWWVGNDGDYHEGTGETPELAAELALNRGGE